MSNILRMACLAACLILTVSASADAYIKREMRATWMTTYLSLDWPSQKGTSATIIQAQKQEAITYLDELKKTNINTVLFQIRPSCDAFYKSSYEPWSKYLTGTRGKDPGWDPLQFWIEESHKRGIELHAWMNPYRFYVKRADDPEMWNTPQDMTIRNNGWVLNHNNNNILNPGLPAVRTYICNVVKDIISRYDVDGIVFDDYFYQNGIPSNSSAGDYNLFKQSGWTYIGNWRRNNVNNMIKDVYNTIKSIKPYIRFGVSPAGAACTDASVASGHGVNKCPVGSDWQYNGIFSDPVAWIKGGYIDYISPQLYWESTHSTNPFKSLDNWWSYIAQKFNRHYYCSASTYKGDVDMGADYEEGFGGLSELSNQIIWNRQQSDNGIPGLFSYRAESFWITHKVAAHFRSTVYQKPAVVPTLPTHTSATNYDKVNNLEINGSTLNWDNINGVRYLVYAIPNSTTTALAQSSTTNTGIRSEFLLGASYTNSYTIPVAYQEGYYFAVTIYDRYGYEYPPRYSNEITKSATKVSLKTPSNASSVKSEIVFSWSAGLGKNPTYKIELSKDAKFKTIEYEKTGLKTPSHKINATTELEALTTYYWRIITSEDNTWDSTSDSWSFITSDKEPTEPATLLSPANGEQLPDVEMLTFSWNEATGCTYTLEIANDANFSDVTYTKTTGSKTSATIETRILTYNATIYWRVRTSRTGYKDSFSDIWMAKTPKREYAEKVKLISPANGSTFSENFIIEFSKVNVTNYKLEISTSPEFTSRVIVTSYSPGGTVPEGWGISDSGNMTFFVKAARLNNGKYFWRVTTSFTGIYDSSSETGTFFISNASTETGYIPKYETFNYPLTPDYLSISSLWYRSADTGNKPSDTDAKGNRSFCVLDNVIYISGHLGTWGDTNCYITKYNATTGARIGSITLNLSGNTSHYQANTIMKDNGGNLLVSNISTGATKPIQLYKINPETGSGTLIATLTTQGRTDHVAVYGNVSTGDFFVLGALSGTNKVQKWTYQGGRQTQTETMTASRLWPSDAYTAYDFGTAPRVFPIDSDRFFINGGNISLTKYSFSTGSMDSFDSNDQVKPNYVGANYLYTNGGCFFEYQHQNYIVYPNGNDKTGGYTFDIVKTNENYDYNDLTLQWSIPKYAKGLGTTYSSNGDACIDYEKSKDGKSVNLYFYVPSNGICAYTIYRNVPSGVEGIEESELELLRTGTQIIFNQEVDIAEIYNTSGMLIARSMKTSTIDLNAPNGIYIIRAVKGNKTIVKKVAM